MNKKLKKMLCLGLCLLLTVGTLLASETAQAASAFSFKYNGATGTPGKSAKSLCKKGGKVKYSKSKSCAGSGYDKTYKFKKFTVVTHSSSSSSGTPGTITSITLTSSKVKTQEGIKIGSSESAVKKAYGSGSPITYGSTKSYTYKKGSTRLQIKVKSGKVTYIKYYKA